MPTNELDDDAFSEDVAVEEAPKKRASRKKAAPKELTPDDIRAKRLEEVKANAKRRWRCQVNSMRKGVQHFELMVPDPSNAGKRPIPVRGHCGVIIEDGLPKYVIDMLQNEFHMELAEVPTPMNPTGEDQGLNHKSVRVHHYQVQVFEEIENPKPLGTVK